VEIENLGKDRVQHRAPIVEIAGDDAGPIGRQRFELGGLDEPPDLLCAFLRR